MLVLYLIFKITFLSNLNLIYVFVYFRSFLPNFLTCLCFEVFDVVDFKIFKNFLVSVLFVFFSNFWILFTFLRINSLVLPRSHLCLPVCCSLCHLNWYMIEDLFCIYITIIYVFKWVCDHLLEDLVVDVVVIVLSVVVHFFSSSFWILITDVEYLYRCIVFNVILVCSWCVNFVILFVFECFLVVISSVCVVHSWCLSLFLTRIDIFFFSFVIFDQWPWIYLC